MPDIIPLAHGELGILDEIFPVLIVGIFTVIMIVAGLISRRNETLEDADITDNSCNKQAESSDTHFRLD